MSEVLVREMKMKNGEWKLHVDKERKMVKFAPVGKAELDEFLAYVQAATEELKKFNKGEAFHIVDDTDFEMKFWSIELMKPSRAFLEFLAAYTKKSALIIPSFVLRKAFEIFSYSNVKFFATVQDAEKWMFSN